MLTTTDSKNQAVSKPESLIERGRSRAAYVIAVSLQHGGPGRGLRLSGPSATQRHKSFWPIHQHYAGLTNHGLIGSATLTKAFIALIPVCMLLWGSTVQYFRWKKTASTLLQLLGAGCLVVVVVTHILEALHVMQWMGWGTEHSIGHYLDLCSAVLAFTLFSAGYLLQALANQR